MRADKGFTAKMPNNVICGEGAIQRLSEEVQGRHKKAAVFTDKGVYGAGLTGEVIVQLEKAGCETVIYRDIPPEPTYLEAQELLNRFVKEEADLIVAVGGGSVMDVAKLASLATEGEPVKLYLEHPLLGKKRVKSIMIPTTAGTGSEATFNSIVAVPEKNLKVGIVNPEMMADTVILDGNMIKSLPEKIAAACGIDALAHAIECFTSNKANPYSDMFALNALQLIFDNIIEACKSTENIEAKNAMLLAAFYGGVAISTSGTTAVHALSYPLGGRYHIAHGVANAILLMPVMRYNQDACERELAAVYERVCSEKAATEENDILPKTDKKKGDWVLSKMEQIVKELEIPQSLTAFNVGKEDLEELIKAGLDVKRLLDNNKKEITYEDAKRIYLEVL